MGNVKIRPRKARIFQRSVSEGSSAADSNSIAVDSAGGGTYPNEPDGFISICEHDYSVIPSGSNGVSGTWYTAGGTTNMTIQSDGSGEQSDPNYLRIRYPAGQTVGTAPAHWGGWSTSPVPGGQQSQLYMSTWLRIWGAGDGTYENNAIGTKLWYTPYRRSDIQSVAYFMAKPSPGGSLGDTNIRTQFRLEYDAANSLTPAPGDPCSSTGGGAIPRAMNIDSTPLDVGVWYQIEVLLQSNTVTCPPTYDGVYKMWANGVLKAHHTNLGYRNSVGNLGFYQYRCHGVYGGEDSGVTKDRDDYIDWGHSYCSGVPI